MPAVGLPRWYLLQNEVLGEYRPEFDLLRGVLDAAHVRVTTSAPDHATTMSQGTLDSS